MELTKHTKTTLRFLIKHYWTTRRFVWVKEGMAYATNLDQYVRGPVEKIEDGVYTIKSIKEAIKTKSAYVLEKADSNYYEEYPETRKQEYGHSVVLAAGVLQDVLHFVAKDTHRWAINSVFFNLEKGCVVGTDGIKLIKIEVATPEEWTGPKCLVPYNAMKNIPKCSVIVSFSNTHYQIWFKGIYIEGRFSEGIFPNYEKIIEGAKSDNVVVFDKLKRVGDVLTKVSSKRKIQINAEYLDMIEKVVGSGDWFCERVGRGCYIKGEGREAVLMPINPT